jgi:hypothetical protein
MDAVVAILSIKINDERSAEKQQDHRHPYHLCTSLMPSLAHSVSEITVGQRPFSSRRVFAALGACVPDTDCSRCFLRSPKIFHTSFN